MSQIASKLSFLQRCALRFLAFMVAIVIQLALALIYVAVFAPDGLRAFLVQEIGIFIGALPAGVVLALVMVRR